VTCQNSKQTYLREILEMESKNQSNQSSTTPDSASHLFERTPSHEYIEEWTKTLMQPPFSEEVKDALSVLVFRLGLEWLALPTIFFKEVASRRMVHHIPHRSDKILKGVVNLNGELKLYVALDQLLEIKTITSSLASATSYQQDRIVAIAKEGDLWVFPVEEIDGIYRWDLAQIENVPVNVSKSTADFVKGIMKMENKSVGLIDEELLFSSLKRSIQ
jgi:chemotaxis-related protein WspD